MNSHFQNPKSMKTIQRELHAASIHGRVATSKNVSFGMECYEDITIRPRPLNRKQLQWEQVIWSDESSLTLFSITRCVLVLKTSVEPFHVDSLIPTVKHGEIL
ncbi:transposable element Tc1 transposase [Trichonephila clavipes]|uniref:Transposable element Tc1 transposase n=1 Tax=Trichonephila clavipes TaxID=2585209 RepID=A0A8X6V8V9_TRICX|nr:transposable element Tc1 transposase [Trichonephila clavipes]